MFSFPCSLISLSSLLLFLSPLPDTPSDLFPIHLNTELPLDSLLALSLITPPDLFHSLLYFIILSPS